MTIEIPFPHGKGISFFIVGNDKAKFEFILQKEERSDIIIR